MKQERNAYTWFCLLLSIVVFQGAQAQNSNILETLTVYDNAWLASLKMELVATYPTTAFDKDQGFCTASVKMSSDGDQQAFVINQLGMDPVHFSGDRRSADYTESGDYTLTYAKRIMVHFGSDSSKIRIDNERKKISAKDNSIETSAGSPFIEVHPKNHYDSKNRMFRFLLPLGRGFSELLDEVTEVTTSEEGLLYLTARGNLFSPNSGQWFLEIDPERDYLVRAATFSHPGSSHKSSFKGDIQSGMSARTELPIWNAGSSALIEGYEIDVQLIGYTAQPDLLLQEEVSSEVNRIAPKSTLIDYVVSDENGQPFILRGLAVP